MVERAIAVDLEGAAACLYRVVHRFEIFHSQAFGERRWHSLIDCLAVDPRSVVQVSVEVLAVEVVPEFEAERKPRHCAFAVEVVFVDIVHSYRCRCCSVGKQHTHWNSFDCRIRHSRNHHHNLRTRGSHWFRKHHACCVGDIHGLRRCSRRSHYWRVHQSRRRGNFLHSFVDPARILHSCHSLVARERVHCEAEVEEQTTAQKIYHHSNGDLRGDVELGGCTTWFSPINVRSSSGAAVLLNVFDQLSRSLCGGSRAIRGELRKQRDFNEGHELRLRKGTKRA